MLVRCLLAISFAAVLSGCWGGLLGDSSNTRAYRITGTPTAAKRQQVRSIVEGVAKHANYEPGDWPAWIPGGLAFQARDWKYTFAYRRLKTL